MRARRSSVLAAVLLVAACRRTASEETAGPPSDPAPPAPSASATIAPDRLAPGELVEGRKKALGVFLPRDVHEDASFADLVYASGPVGVHPLVEYFRARLIDGSLREGPEAATFEHVHVPDAPGKDLRVHIVLRPGGCRVELRDTTSAPVPVLPDNDARWRQVGLTPQGRLADPTHLD